MKNMGNQHEKNNEPKLICYIGGGYGWEKIYYDEKNNQFYKDSYHCGAVDICETYYDGREFLTREEVIKIILKEKDDGKEKEEIISYLEGLK